MAGTTNNDPHRGEEGGNLEKLETIAATRRVTTRPTPTPVPPIFFSSNSFPNTEERRIFVPAATLPLTAAAAAAAAAVRWVVPLLPFGHCLETTTKGNDDDGR